MNLKKSDKFLLIILGFDIIFIVLSLFDKFSSLNFYNFAVENDYGFAEKFQYLKFIGIAIISFILAVKSRSSNFLFFMFIPIYLYLDDSRLLHERFGTKIVSFFYKGSPLDTLIKDFRYQDIGEIVYILFISIILLIIFLICYKLSDLFERYFLKNILKLLIIFGFFALFIDSIHQLSRGYLYNLLTVIEDGGEMISISLIIANFFKYLNEKKINYFK